MKMFEGMLQRDKDEFTRISNRLLSQCFICKKNETTRADYYFIMKHKDKFTEYLSVLGYRLEINEECGVVQLVNTQNYNRYNMKLFESIILLILRILYDEKKRELSVSDEVLVNMGDIHEKFMSLKIRDAIIETTVDINKNAVKSAIKRIAGRVKCDIVIVPQDEHLSKNQSKDFRCGDNGIFKGMPLTEEQKQMSKIAKEIYSRYPYDGKYILDEARLIICQSNVKSEELQQRYYYAQVNPLGDWTGGTNVDTGATNRKLGSDMADSVTGGGLHGKDLSKADVSVNIYAFLKAQRTGKHVSLCCAIGDDMIDGIPYPEIVRQAKEYIDSIGGFEKFAEWGLF